MSNAISGKGIAAIGNCLRLRLGALETVVLDQVEVCRLIEDKVVLTPEIVREIAGRVVEIEPGLMVSGESFIVLEGDASQAFSLVLAARSMDAWARRAGTLRTEYSIDDAVKARLILLNQHDVRN